MPAIAYAADSPEPIDLRNPQLAALLAWLIPGAGHFYQRRTGKGVLFTVCILGTFLYGLFLGEGKVVYASWRNNDTRWAYFCQIGAGLPALPALVQAERIRNGRPPLFGSKFMAPPELPQELSWWNKYLHRYFELGTVYTMIAGLLNVLAIYDAYAGPVPLELPGVDPSDPADDEEDDDDDEPNAAHPAPS